MSKNYFIKNLLAASMLLAVSMGMSSCSGFVDAVLGTSDKPTTQPTTQPTTAGAVITADQTTITISSFEEMAKAVSAEQNEAFIKAIETKAAAGEKYTINFKSEKPLSTENFEGLVIPRVVGSKIDVVFDQPLVTSESNPLKVTADEKNSDTPTDAVNELTITLPNGSDNVYLSVNMPETTVKLEGNVTYQFVEAITAINTLIVGSGVVIGELLLKGGRAIVQDGGAIETYVYPAGKKNSDGEAFISVCYDEDLAPYAGVLPPTLKVDETVCYELSTDEKGEKPYLAKSLKVVKGSEDEAEVNFLNQHGHFLEKMIVGDGANVVTRGIRAKEIEGEGTAKITFICIEAWQNPKSGSWQHEPTPDNMDEFYWQFGTNGLKGVEKISNIIFAKPQKEWNGEYYTFLKDVSATVENCTFQYDCVFFGHDWIGELGKGTEYTLSNGKVIKNCKFETTAVPYPNIAQGVFIYVPEQPLGSTFTMTFDNCEFKEGTHIVPHCLTDNGYAFDTDPGNDNQHNFYKLIGYGYFDDSGISVTVNSLDDIPANCLDGINGGYYYSYDSGSPLRYNYSDNVVQLEFNNCTIGGSALTAADKAFNHPGYGPPHDNPAFPWSYMCPKDGLTFNYICNSSSGTSTGKWVYLGYDGDPGDILGRFDIE